ncbi:MAG: hypothetical protein ACJ8KA_12755 [Sulfurifustis sp.]
MRRKVAAHRRLDLVAIGKPAPSVLKSRPELARRTEERYYPRVANIAHRAWQCATARLRELGPLRVALLAAAGVALVLIPAPGTRPVYSGWPLVTTLLIPVAAPLLFLLLLLDALMSRVFLIDAEGLDRQRRKTAIIVNLLAAALLIVRWLPYYSALRV